MKLGPSWDELSQEDRAYIRLSQLLWIVTGGLLAITAALLAAFPIEFRNGPLSLNFVTFVVFGPVAIIYTYLRFDVRVAAFCESIALLSSFTLIGAVYTYVLTRAAASVPMWDARLLSADHALGLDWKSYLAWVNAHPGVGWILNSSYESILKQVAVLSLLLAAFKEHRRLQGFLLAAQLSIIICGLGGAVMPAVGAYATLAINATTDHPNIVLANMSGHDVAHVLQLRGATPFFQIGHIEGIIMFPSFHMALAILFTWAFWRVPVVRWIALALNLAMVAATPLSGGHYFVDLAGGVIVALVSIAAVSWVQAAVDRKIQGRVARPNPSRPAGIAVPFRTN